ncbi:hypothetical protein AK88_04706 [Plasmodium fragile]|uniref:Uncharacterized protein n=1 Tax=Plasmodium fragile TaxID=5857 RepID=A0A0D9QF69_PLAFR|nr:uncharacterized protein AK88_04706 [Plasmodium fragile]KJP85675.1 hypothetical protein AK88_04706 [Plasmodium fragile]
MKDPLEYINKINFNTNRFPQYTHILMENGDDVGPFVAKLSSYKLSDEDKLKQQKYNEKYIKINKKLSSDNSSMSIFKFNYKPYVNNKFKKSIMLSAVVLTSALLYDKREKLRLAFTRGSGGKESNFLKYNSLER